MRRRDLDQPSGQRRQRAADGVGVLRPIRPLLDPAEVATRLAPVLTWEGAPYVAERSWRLVARTDEFDAWLIAWPVGGRVELHDHGRSRGAISVVNGRLVEAVPQRGNSGRLSLVTRSVAAGETLGFDADHVHDVVNEGPEAALSLHVYSPGLRSMTFYAVEEEQLVARRVEWAVDGAEEPAGRVAVR
jgi:predicted metal-dependent enzyme (double-stranded beta helix superfamily)